MKAMTGARGLLDLLSLILPFLAGELDDGVLAAAAVVVVVIVVELEVVW